jgi:hypothetical protein
MLNPTLRHFITEREAIRMRRASGQPRPWTDDPILSAYRFCNIHRRDDRVSRWLLKHYYPHTAKGLDAWFPALVARFINWPPTLKLLLESGVGLAAGETWKPELFESVISQLKLAGEKVYTGAYMIYPGSKDGGSAMAKKEQFLARQVFAGALANGHKIRHAMWQLSIEKTVHELTQSYGIQTFMAGQVAADLTYLYDALDLALDKRTYAPMGPGSIRGLNRLHNFKLTQTWQPHEFVEALMTVHRNIEVDLKILDLTLHDVQNIMCEFDKYERVRQNEGRPRSGYKPETAY